MRLGFVLDTLYVLGSLWTKPAEAQVCLARPYAHPAPIREAARLRGLRRSVPGAIAFVNVNVIPMDRERVLAHQTVLIEDGRITALAPTGTVKVPATAARIDGRGKYLMPGLADMHVHDYGGQEDERVRTLFSYLASGVTTIRHLRAASDAETAIFRKTTEAQLGPRVYVSSGRLGLESTRLDSVAAAVAAYKAAGNDYILMATNLSSKEERTNTAARFAQSRHALPALDDSIIAVAHRLGIPVASHFHRMGGLAGESFQQMLAYGVGSGSVDHLYSFWDTLGYPLLSSAIRGSRKVDVSVSEFPALAAAAQRAGVWITPTMDCMEYHKYVGKSDAIEITRQLVQALQDAGTGLLLGADGMYAQNELAALVRAGLTPYQALVTGTRNPAQYLGVLGSAGTVAVGKWADLVLLFGNPLQNIRYTREPAGVMLAGRWLDRAELDQRLLASPKAWLTLAVERSYLSRTLRDQLRVHVAKFRWLTDSLVRTKQKSSEYERVLELLAGELRAMRTSLPLEEHAIFDPLARVWLREQIRQGYRVAVPGVRVSP